MPRLADTLARLLAETPEPCRPPLWRRPVGFHPAAVLAGFLGGTVFFLNAPALRLLPVSVLLAAVLGLIESWRQHSGLFSHSGSLPHLPAKQEPCAALLPRVSPSAAGTLWGLTLFAATFILLNWLFAPEHGSTLITLPATPLTPAKHLTTGGLTSSVIQAVRLLAVLGLSRLLTLLLPLEALGGWLVAVAPKTGLLFQLAASFLPRIVRDAQRIAFAWECRLAAQGAPRPHRVWTLPTFWQALFNASLEAALETATALRARGCGSGRYVPLFSPRWRAHDSAMTLAGFAAAASAFW